MIGQGYDCLEPEYLKFDGNFLRVPCGKCYNCKKRRTLAWSARLEAETQYYQGSEVLFLTLTYAPENVPWNYVDGELLTEYEKRFYKSVEINGQIFYQVTTNDRKAVTNYIKRLRKAVDKRYGSHVVGEKVVYNSDGSVSFDKLGNIVLKPIKKPNRPLKYYAVSEYGTEKQRPHIHIMMFGLTEKSDGDLIRKAWLNPNTPPSDKKSLIGFVKIEPFDSIKECKYIAGYVQKKLYGSDSCPWRLPEFLQCSQGLGDRWFFDHLYLFNDEHPYIPSGKYKVALPRKWRKILIDKGILKEISQTALYVRQQMEKLYLYKKLENQGINPDDFFKQRYENAKAQARAYILGDKRREKGEL